MTLHQMLLGELIGIARAVDGNEHLLRPATDALLREGLSAAADPAADLEYLNVLLQRITDEKRALVPGCFACAAPCGRTAAYDMTGMETAPADVRAAKEQLLSDLFRAAKNNAVPVRALYPPLFAIGLEEVSAKELQLFANDLDAVLIASAPAETAVHG